MNNAKILIVDDESDIRSMLQIAISRMGHTPSLARDVTEAKQLIQNQPFDMVLTDMKLPGGDGFDILRYSNLTQPETPCAMITAFGSVDLAINALKEGAFDFLNKPLELSTLRNVINNALNQSSSKPKGFENTNAIVGSSDAIATLKKKIAKLSKSMAPVYISGESGSGKELAARALHLESPRAAQPFVPVNCGAIPRELMESEFFGHLKGSFTGAHADKNGLFSAANGGTLFLDEVADLPLDMQVKLLRVLQERRVRPIGSDKEIDVDVRVLTATHKDLSLEVASGRFRQDLFYRINVIELNVPPLRERRSDLPLLWNHFLKQFAQESDQTVPTLTPQAQDALLAYGFPGNVRELVNILERAFTMCEDDIVSVDDLGLNSNASNPEVDLNDIRDIDGHLAELERTILISAIHACDGNRTAAAKRLGITFRSLRYRLDRLNITT